MHIRQTLLASSQSVNGPLKSEWEAQFDEGFLHSVEARVNLADPYLQATSDQ
jgi:hypothetical protein